MKNNKVRNILLIALVGLLCILVLPLGKSQVGTVGLTPYYSEQSPIPFPFFGENPIATTFTESMCGEGTDFLIEILPGSCSPAVIRSDLLEESPVPVFCKLTGIKINPLIEVPYIRRVQVERNERNDYISSVYFYGARKGLATAFSPLIASPRESNLGYLVVWLNRIPNEKDMPENIILNLSARVEYDIRKSIGIADDQLFIQEQTEEEWNADYEKNSFWNGRGYIRVKEIGKDEARIQVYAGRNQPIITYKIKEGDKSPLGFLPGFYCSAGYRIRLDEISHPVIRAELDVNGERVIVTKDSKIKDTSCIVQKITPSLSGYGGSITIKGCGDGRYDLIKEAAPTVTLIVNGVKNEYKVGGFIDEENKLVLAHVAKTRIKGKEKDFIIALEKDKYPRFIKQQTVKKLNDKRGTKELSEDDELAFKNDVEKIFKKDELRDAKIYTIVEMGDLNVGNKKLNIKIIDTNILKNANHSQEIEKYYREAINTYRDIQMDYPSFEFELGNKTKSYGEVALWQSAEIAKNLNKYEDEVNFLNELIKEYPDSGFNIEGKKRLSLLYTTTDPIKATKFIEDKGEGYSISLKEITTPSKDEKNVELQIGLDSVKKYEVGDLIGDGRNWTIDEIDEEEVTFRNVNSGIPSIKIKKNDNKALGTSKVRVYNINLKKFVKVSLISEAKARISYANFTFGVGIEKRGINLTPEKTEEYISKLNKTIEDFEKINKKLNKTIVTWKKACLIGSTALWVSSFFDNLGGKSAARKDVIRGIGGEQGWMDKCTKLVKEDKERWKTVSNCLLMNSPTIDKQVNLLTEAKSFIDSKSEGKNVSQIAGLLAGYKSSYKGREDFKFTTKEGSERSIKDVLDTLDNVDSFKFKSDALDLYEKLELVERCEGDELKDSLICKNARNVLGKSLESYGDELSKIKSETTAKEKLNIDFLKMYEPKDKQIAGDVISEIKETTRGTAKITSGDATQQISVAKYGFAGAYYLAVVEYTQENEYAVKETYKYTDDSFTKLEKIEEKPPTSKIKGMDTIKSCTNNLYEGEKEIRFWESGDNAGLPALMPIDLEKGYYMATKSSQSGLEAYGASGKLQNFYICNVGPNGNPDFDFGTGELSESDDCCTPCPYSSVGQCVGNLPGLTKIETDSIEEKALACTREAASAYNEGKKTISTSCCQSCGHGRPALPTPAVACEDFMSPENCMILYNLCDPVVCPPSRCDLGGKYKVSNVIQTGVIGGATLCLHNFPQVIVPVCLSGIHAGLDNIITILKSAESCLKENLETGRHVGICDEILSVYWCELFWKEAMPFLKFSAPDIMASLLIGEREGGEYANFMSAWQTAEETASYFSQFYAKNAFEAFKIRSTAQAGTEVCKNFASIAYPNSADILESWATPESPYQFNARFSEEQISTATIPATSAYYVYAHIYAGQERGRYYRVYLRQPPAAGYYRTPEIYVIPGLSSYLNAGEYLDIKREFIAPSGYKELCVSIDAQEYCGFKQVSTDFGLNELVDLYVKDVAVKEEITTERECVSGTGSLIPTSLSPQAYIDDLIDPAIYKRGIIRVCATHNPGEGTEPTRWEPIGYCDSNKIMKCWLDQNSVKGAIKDTRLEEKALEEAKELSNQILVDEGFMSGEESAASLKEIKDKIAELNIPKLIASNNLKEGIGEVVNGLQEIRDRSVSPKDRADASLELAALYDSITLRLRGGPLPGEGGQPTVTPGECAKASTEATCLRIKGCIPFFETKKESVRTFIACKKCPSAASCEDYIDRAYCNYDSCNLGCEWLGGQCRESPCDVTAMWSSDSEGKSERDESNNGSEVYVVAKGTKGCEGKDVTFKIYEDNPIGNKFMGELKGKFENNLASAVWKVAWLDDGFLQGDPEYFFKAEGDFRTEKSKNLDVRESLEEKEEEKEDEGEEEEETTTEEMYLETGITAGQKSVLTGLIWPIGEKRIEELKKIKEMADFIERKDQLTIPERLDMIKVLEDTQETILSLKEKKVELGLSDDEEHFLRQTRGHLTKIESEYKQIESDDKISVTIKETLENIPAESGDEENPYKILNEGYSLYGERKYDEAIEKFKAVFKYYDKDDSCQDCALYYLGKSYEEIKDYAEAKNSYEDLLKNYPNSILAEKSSEAIDRLKIEIAKKDPIILPILDINVIEGDRAILVPVGYDPDGGDVSFEFEAPFDSSGIFRTKIGDAPKKYSVQVTITDDEGNKASTSFDVNIVEPEITEILLISSKGNILDDKNKLIKEDDKITIYSIIKDQVGNYYLGNINSNLPVKAVIKGSTIGLKKWDNSWQPLSFSWYEIIAKEFHEGKDCKNEYCWYTNVVPDGDDEGKWIGLDTIEYHHFVISERDGASEWKLAPKNIVGTRHYRAEINSVSSPGKETAYVGGLPGSTHRISRRSDFCKESNKCDIGCKYIELVESYIGVPWLYGPAGYYSKHQTEKYLGIECADLLTGAWRMATGYNIPYVAANTLANGKYTEDRGGYGEIRFTRSLFRSATVTDERGNEIQIPVGNGENEVHIGDLILLKTPGENKYHHATVFYKDNGNGVLDSSDKVLSARHGGVEEDTLGSIISRIPLLGKGEYFRIKNWKTVPSQVNC